MSTFSKIRYKAGYKYQLAENYYALTSVKKRLSSTQFLNLRADGVLLIRAGYAWDGPSGPTFDTKSFMRASLVHDALYQLIALGALGEKHRKIADDDFKRTCREDGMFWWRVWYAYRFVRRFGGFAVRKDKQVFTAP